MSEGARRLRLGTRGSDLALTQSGTVAAALSANGHEVELSVIRTAGDRSTAPSFGAIGPQGVFVREIEQALIRREIDLAVHSYKDLPTTSPEELVIGAVPERIDPADVLLIRESAASGSGAALLPVEPGARIGTSSARRQAWIKHFREDLDVQPLRGNVPTRIRRLKEAAYDAIVLAAAGLARLRDGDDRFATLLDGISVVRLDPAAFVPAPSQGALAVQCRSDVEDVLAALTAIDHTESRASVDAERTALAHAEGGCDLAFGAYCRAGVGGYTLTAMIERDQGRVRTASIDAADAGELGTAAWHALSAALD